MRLVFLVLFALRGLSSTSPAAVHATLISSEPAAHSHLTASPTRVRLVFSEPIEGTLARVTLVPGAGAPLTLRAGGDPRDVHAIIAPVDSLVAGKYRVQWRVVSADGHAVDGSYLFTVGDTTLGGQMAPPPPTEPAQEMQPPAPEAEEPDVWGPSLYGAPFVPAIARGLALGALMAAAGVLLFLATAAPNAAQTTDSRVRTLATALAVAAPVLLAAHGVAWLINTSPDHTLDAAWAASALSTTVGKIEIWRTSLAALALWAWWLARRPGLALLFAAAALAVSGASGHSAAMQPAFAIPAKAIHLMASAVWLGGLLWLVVRPADDTLPLFATDADRVSSRALLAVIAVAVTGAIQTLLFLPSITDVATSPYGWFALAKTAGLLTLAGFGAYNRQRVMPSMATDAAAGGTALRSSVTRELFVMALVILLGGLLAYIPPPGEGAEDQMTTHQSTS